MHCRPFVFTPLMGKVLGTAVSFRIRGGLQLATCRHREEAGLLDA